MTWTKTWPGDTGGSRVGWVCGKGSTRVDEAAHVYLKVVGEYGQPIVKPKWEGSAVLWHEALPSGERPEPPKPEPKFGEWADEPWGDGVYTVQPRDQPLRTVIVSGDGFRPAEVGLWHALVDAQVMRWYRHDTTTPTDKG